MNTSSCHAVMLVSSRGQSPKITFDVLKPILSEVVLYMWVLNSLHIANE